IGCSTIKSFKGLESNVVIVTELDETIHSRPENVLVNELYVGLSRAKNHLIVMRSEKFRDDLLPV
ncbi:MAG: ATP-binding domain-containing protein, partial [Cyanobacteria bacterium REEB67]|nr:ATP-binding domain-containing protein [Cyanobacteria bacterium REEB67]